MKIDSKSSLTGLAILLGIIPIQEAYALPYGYYYAFEDLGPVAGQMASMPMGVNGTDTAAGVSFDYPYGNNRCVRYNVGSAPDYTNGSDYCDANAIDRQGTVVGSTSLPSGYYEAFVWPTFGGLTTLGTLGGSWSVAEDISDNGYIVGWSDVNYGTPHAYIYDTWLPWATMVDLGTLPGDVYSYANGVDNRGVVVGNSESSTFFSRAFVLDYPGNTRIDLSTHWQWNQTYANDIDDSGVIVGSRTTPIWSQHAVVWEEIWWSPGQYVSRDLGELPGGSWSDAHAIGGSTPTAVGSSFDANSVSRAVAWDVGGGTVTDLNAVAAFVPPQFTLNEATDIGPMDAVVGWGTYPNQPPRGFRLVVRGQQLVP